MAQPQPYMADIDNLPLKYLQQAPLDPRLGLTQTSSSYIRWVIGIQRLDGSSCLRLVPVSRPDPDTQVLRSTRSRLCCPSSAWSGERWISMLFTKTIVGTAVVNHAMANDVNPQMQIRVSLKNFEYDSLLTEVLVGPWRLRETHYRSTKGYLAFDSSASNHLSGQKVVVFRRVLDKGRIAWLLVSLSLISPALGTLVGILSKRADVGVAVAAGIFALASFVQGLAAWFSG